MKASFSAWFEKGEALAKKLADQAAQVTERAKNEEWVSKVSTSVVSAVESIKSEYNSAFNPKISRLRYMDERLISIDFPGERVIDEVSSELRAKYQDEVLIINMSERVYDYDKMPGHVVSVNFRGLPSPPLDVLCRLCLQMHQWLTRSDKTVVVIHCFPGYSRTAVLTSCYLAWCGKCMHPVDALDKICDKLGIVDDVDNLQIDSGSSGSPQSVLSAILPSQKRYINYFYDLLEGDEGIAEKTTMFPSLRVGLVKLLLNGVPKLPIGDKGDFRPFFEIWQNGQLVASSLPKRNSVSSMESLVKAVVSYPIEESSVRVDGPLNIAPPLFPIPFTVDPPVSLSGDVLFRIRHLTSNGGRFTCLRFAFNTNQLSWFIQPKALNSVFHLAQQDLDGNLGSMCTVDLVFDSTVGRVNDHLSEEDVENASATRGIFQAARQLSRKLRDAQLRQSKHLPTTTELDEEELLLRALGASETHSTAQAPSMVGSKITERFDIDQSPPANGERNNDVDDFFAQLELDARIE